MARAELAPAAVFYAHADHALGAAAADDVEPPHATALEASGTEVVTPPRPGLWGGPFVLASYVVGLGLLWTRVIVGSVETAETFHIGLSV